MQEEGTFEGHLPLQPPQGDNSEELSQAECVLGGRLAAAGSWGTRC